MNEPLNILLSNRKEYETGGTDGAWLKLPATAEQLGAALTRIGASGGAHGEDYFITAFESEIPALSRIPVYNLRRAGINELNYIAGQLQKTEPSQMEKLSAALEFASKGDNIYRLPEYAANNDFFEHHPNINNHSQLGKYLYEKAGGGQLPAEWVSAVDMYKLGWLAAKQDNGVFTDSHGYIAPKKGALESFTEIPEDYKIVPESSVPSPGRSTGARMYDSAAAIAPYAAAAPIELESGSSRDKIIEITNKLEAGIKGIFESDMYKSFLKTLSKFHSYSFNNCILIALQKPDATHVAGYNAWRDDFKRQVKKGEKAIKIFAPAPIRATQEFDRLDADGRPVHDRFGQKVTEQVEVNIPMYKVVSVFDVSQTYGEPLPKIAVDGLLGKVDGYKDLYSALEKASPVPIGFEPLENGASGYYSPAEKRIALNSGMGELQNLKTMIHEIAHARLHDRDANAPDNEPKPDNNTREVEAEAIAYTVCQRYGLDTSDYSFGYVASWSGGKQLDTLKASLDAIRKEAGAIIIEADKYFSDISRSRELAKTQSPELMTRAEMQNLVDGDMTTQGRVMPWTADVLTENGYKFYAGKLVQIAPGAAEQPKQGDSVAANEAKSGETITPPGLSEAMKKENETARKQSAVDKQSPKKQNESAAARQTAQKAKTARKAAQEKPSIREELAAAKKQAAAQKTQKPPSHEKTQALEV